MRDLIARALAWALGLLLPSNGAHRAERAPEHQGDELPADEHQDQDQDDEPRVPLFERPGREHPDAQMFQHRDDPTLIGAYYVWQLSDEEQRQIERRQALLLALDGIDVDQRDIHAVLSGGPDDADEALPRDARRSPRGRAV